MHNVYISRVLKRSRNRWRVLMSDKRNQSAWTRFVQGESMRKRNDGKERRERMGIAGRPRKREVTREKARSFLFSLLPLVFVLLSLFSVSNKTVWRKLLVPIGERNGSIKINVNVSVRVRGKKNSSIIQHQLALIALTLLWLDWISLLIEFFDVSLCVIQIYALLFFSSLPARLEMLVYCVCSHHDCLTMRKNATLPRCHRLCWIFRNDSSLKEEEDLVDQ